MTRETRVRTRYWAAARAAMGVGEDFYDVVGDITLAALEAQILSRHPGTEAERVLGVCSVLVDEEPRSSVTKDSVLIGPGSTVEFLPPFAGG